MPVVISAASLAAVLLMMLAELRLSRANERTLRARGAVEPAGDVYRTMEWGYPAAFVVMALEGAIAGPPPGASTVIGASLFVAAKGLKYWAIGSLGSRWTFRVLVPPDAPRVTRGPYAFLNHPNYVGVVGELVAMACLVGARVTGPLATLWFCWLLRNRIAAENAALRHPPCT